MGISQLNQQFDELENNDLDLDVVSRNEDNEDILAIMEIADQRERIKRK